MTIKQQGGIFGRNPTFNNVDVEGTLTVNGEPISDFGTMAQQNADSVNIDGGSIDAVTLGTNSPVTEMQVDNININGNTISSTNTNGNVLVDTNGTGHAHVTGSKGLTWTDYGATTAMTIIGTQAGNTTSSSMFVNTPSVNGNYGSGFAVDGVYGSGSATRSTVNLYALGTKNPGYTSRMTFYTTNGSSFVECGSFTNAGNLAFPDGKGIDFSATSGTGTSELFDDYEEGTWTPVVADAESGGNNCTMSAEPFTFGRYTKIGRLVHVEGSIRISGVSGVTTSNSAYITGLPFTPNSTGSGLKGGCVVRASYLDTPANCVNLGVSVRSTSTLTINTSIDASNSTTLTVANIQSTNANHFVSFNVSYYV